MTKAGTPAEKTRSPLTAQVSSHLASNDAAELRGLTFVVASGPDSGKVLECSANSLSVGTASDNDLVLTDPTVSRRHCELVATPSGMLLRDLHSTNGTRLGGTRIQSAYVRAGVLIHIGGTTIALESSEGREGSASTGRRPERTLWRSASMGQLLAILGRVSRYDSTVLLQGETGTGKTLLARMIHKASARAAAPFLVVDCGAIPPTLIETELFGHEKGSFTGAQTARVGSFEAARGGTVFLDEVGELPLDMQPKLLRALEDRTVKRIGSATPLQLDVRVIAATNRDLAGAVAAGRFRSDLLYRLNTVSLTIPPLRDRPEDIPVLAEHFYRECIGDPEAVLPGTVSDDLLNRSWPGNARELRSAIERLVVLGDMWAEGAMTPPLVDTQRLPLTANESGLSFREAKENAVAVWEQEFIGNLLQRTGGNLSQAAREARMDRNYLRELARRYGVESPGFKSSGRAGQPNAGHSR